MTLCLTVSMYRTKKSSEPHVTRMYYVKSPWFVIIFSTYRGYMYVFTYFSNRKLNPYKPTISLWNITRAWHTFCQCFIFSADRKTQHCRKRPCCAQRRQIQTCTVLSGGFISTIRVNLRTVGWVDPSAWNSCFLLHICYSWIPHGLRSGPTLAFSLWLSDFKTKISFGFLIKKSGIVF